MSSSSGSQTYKQQASLCFTYIHSPKYNNIKYYYNHIFRELIQSIQSMKWSCTFQLSNIVLNEFGFGFQRILYVTANHVYRYMFKYTIVVMTTRLRLRYLSIFYRCNDKCSRMCSLMCIVQNKNRKLKKYVKVLFCS